MIRAAGAFGSLQLRWIVPFSSLSTEVLAVPTGATAAYSTAKNGSSSSEDVVAVTKNRRRRRHDFGSADEIPSFRDFQQQMQVRSLYRQFTRQARKSAHSTASSELQDQIRREFLLPKQDNWHIQRALSEGGRRYKEMLAMLGNSVRNSDKSGTKTDNSKPSDIIPPASTTSKWPWNHQRNDGKSTWRPSPFPPKSNL